MPHFIFIFFLGMLFLTSSCTKKIADPSIISRSEIIASETGVSGEFHFLNVGSFILKINEEVLVNDPFLTNISMKKVLFSKLHSDTLLADSLLSSSFIDRASLTLIGHGHYDHVMDISAYEKHIASPNHQILSSSGVQNMLSAFDLKSKLIDVEKTALSENQQELTWHYSYNKKIRVAAIASWHPSHIFGKVFYAQSYKTPLKSKPLKTKHYKMGTPMIYLVDFIENNQVVFRAFIQTSSDQHFDNRIPKNILEEKKVDLAIISAAVKNKKTNYQLELIEAIQPTTVILCHWENFFKPYGYELSGVKKSDVEHNYHYIKNQIGATKKVILPGHNARFVIQ